MSESIYKVKIDAFEGPLDLLLHLINQYEIDIYEVPLKEIADQYMNYIHTMQDLHLDIASEYLVMAATLLEIKSNMLLPKQELDFEDEYEEDPQEELIQRLVEYKKYKEASKVLKEKEQESNQVYTRVPVDLTPFQSEEVVKRSEVLSVVDLTEAFQKVLRRKKLLEPMETTIQRQEISIEDRMGDVVNTLHKFKGESSFFGLFEYEQKFEVVTTFLALLELMKTYTIICYQKENFEDITVALTEDYYGTSST
ncbi:segregation/condensation protein A [Alkalibacillus haloalkaliphilus]|uniref:Segregation and condensation protein A n=1 Tax=Alkalibacillus haloalkaliphilus TaxID=94136 RepID=A0A511W2M6_9BACI|nr:segregation/condensation protein A [Alkalibacillus haloalkaliphilus]GEN45197.1 segregation and condensation protein A [Alkalibacillus haloalkaliphilus]